jgi:hypothetical protein
VVSTRTRAGRAAARHRRSSGTAAGHRRSARGTSLRPAADRPARTATRGDRSRLPGQRWDRTGRTTGRPGTGRSWAATRSYRAGRPTARSGRTVQGGTQGPGRPAARTTRACGCAARHTRGRRAAARCMSAGRTATRHTRAGQTATRHTRAGRTATRPGRADGAGGPVGRSGRSDCRQLRGRLADGAIARIVRLRAAPIHSIAAAAVCRPTTHAVIGLRAAAEGRTCGASNSPGGRRPGSARRARHRASGRRAGSSRDR